MRFSLRWLLIVVGLVGPLLFLGRWIGYEVAYGVDDGYAQWSAADMVIGYMNDHDGEWPRSWDSLAPYFAVSNGRVGGWSFEKFKERVWIDFAADPFKLEQQSLKTNQASFDVISATYSSIVMGDGPNQQVHNYFRSRAVESSASSANSAVNP